jgi:hypothetical protein
MGIPVRLSTLLIIIWILGRGLAVIFHRTNIFSLWGYAAEVTYTCEFTVEQLPDEGSIRDSRGLARALTNDFAGAIEDFRFFVERNEIHNGQLQKAWLTLLENGQNPFAEEFLDELK